MMRALTAAMSPGPGARAMRWRICETGGASSSSGRGLVGLGLDLRLRFPLHPLGVAYLDLIHERRPNGTIVLRAVPVSSRERLRRFLRRLVSR